MSDQSAKYLRELPSIDLLLRDPGCEALLARYNRDYIMEHCRAVLDELRAEIRQGRRAAIDVSTVAIIDRVERRIRAAHPAMRYVFLGAEALSEPARTPSPRESPRATPSAHRPG